MAIRLSLRLFRNICEADFRAAAEAVTARVGGQVFWGAPPTERDEDFRTAANNDVFAVSLPYLSGSDYLFCTAIGKMLGAIWMELRIQESALWDYSLYRGDVHLHNFSTFPEYWDNDRKFLRSQRGNPDELCEIWNCEKARVERYLQPWKAKWPWQSYAFAWIKWFYQPPRVVAMDHWYVRMFQEYEILPKGKAYEADDFEYGDYRQMYDFLRALDASDPCDAKGRGRQHRLLLPNAAVFRRAT